MEIAIDLNLNLNFKHFFGFPLFAVEQRYKFKLDGSKESRIINCFCIRIMMIVLNFAIAVLVFHIKEQI
jgi:hypothetical protein